MKFVIVMPIFIWVVYGAPKLRIMPEHLPKPDLLNLPSNATSIRTDISDSFECEGRDYGYYADVDNDCQIFHVCLPISYSDGRNQTFRWSFICPEETIFNQEMFTCTRADEAIECAESPRFYNLNSNFGSIEEEADNTGLHEDQNTVPDEEIVQTINSSNEKRPEEIGRRSRKNKFGSKKN